MTSDADSPSGSAPAPAPAEPSRHFSAGRLVAFLGITLAWMGVVLIHFLMAEQSASKHANPLADADRRLEARLLLASRAPEVRARAPGVLREADLVGAFRRRVEADPRDISERSQYVVALVLDERRREALEQVQKIADLPSGALVAQALQDAFDLGTPRRGDHPRTLTTHAADEGLLRVYLQGWALDAALEGLHRKRGDLAEAEFHRQSLRLAQERSLRDLVLLVTVVSIEVVVGLVTWLVWLVRLGSPVPRPSASPRPEATPLSWDPLAGWAMGLTWQLITIAVAVSFQLALGGAHLGAVWGLVGVQFVIYALSLLCMGLAIRGLWSGVGWHLRRAGPSARLGFLSFPAAFVVIMGVSLLMSALRGPAPSNNPIFEIMRSVSGWQSAVVLLLFVGLVGPVFEEILFRGVLYTSMRQVLPAAWAIPLNGFLFSAVHGDLNGLLPLAILGSILAWQREKTDSLVGPIITHALWNSQTFMATMLLFSS